MTYGKVAKCKYCGQDTWPVVEHPWGNNGHHPRCVINDGGYSPGNYKCLEGRPALTPAYAPVIDSLQSPTSAPRVPEYRGAPTFTPWTRELGNVWAVHFERYLHETGRRR